MTTNFRHTVAPLVTTIQKLFSEDLAKENKITLWCCRPSGRWGSSDCLAGNHKPGYSWNMIQTKNTRPVSEVQPKRNPEERNIRKQLGKVRRYLAKSTAAGFTSSWESRITIYETQLAKAETRARLIR
jgi:hypothetical protein